MDYLCGYGANVPPERRSRPASPSSDTLRSFGYAVAGAPRAIPPRLAAKMLESDTVTNPENVAYRRWHEERRKQRRERGMWRDTDRESLLWGMN